MPRIHRAWAICAGGVLMLFTTVGLGANAFSVYQPYIIAYNNFTNAQGSWIISVRSLFILIGMMTAAWACRRAEYLAGRHKSVREIARDLASKGVERGLIDDALASLVPAGGEDGGDESLDAAACRALVAKHYMRKLAAGRADSVLAALARRGFARADARAAVAAALETLEQEPCGPDGMAARCNEME